MKRLRILSICLMSLIVICLVFSNSKVSAKNELNNDPYSTYTVGLKGEEVACPLAYEGTSVLDLGFSSPEDIYIDNTDLIYIADKGNKIVYIYDSLNKTTKKIGEGILSGPTGVCLDGDGFIYVADYVSKSIFKFDKDNNLIKTYTSPTEALFGEQSKFIPTKVVVDFLGNLYITSEGNANGIIQLNKDGEFMGYFGPNNVNLTLSLFFKRLMLNKQDRETYASLSPKATTNVAIDKKNIVYTVIDGEQGTSLKKYNISGVNVLNKTGFYSPTYQDLTVDNNGFIYTCDKESNGNIQVMDMDGTLLFKFGSIKTSGVMIGEFNKPSGIAVDSNYNIYVLDSVGKNIQIFRRTLFAETVTNAILSYNQGDYDNATIYYNEIIRQNASFVSAYIGLGKILQRRQEYKEALFYFKLANYKAGYSEVFWELRDEWLNKNLIIVIIIIVLLVIMKIFKLWGKLFKLLKIDFSILKEKINSVKFIQELKYLVLMFTKPRIVFDDIKFGLKIRKRTAWILFIVFILINILGDYFVRGYLFKGAITSDINFAVELLKWGVLILLIVLGNYLVSSLQSGEGFLRDIFISIVYCFAPIILFKLPVDALSNLLTYNEAYLYNIANTILWIWSIFNVILMIKEIHNYKFGELVLNIILTFVAVVILVLLFLVVYILIMQLVKFIIGLISEGVYRT